MLGMRPVLLRQTFQEKSLILASVSEASLDNVIYVVWRRVIRALSSRSTFSPFISNWFTEIYFVGHFFVQMIYLKQFGATFSEYFFDLKRTSLKNEGRSRLSNQEVLLSLIFTTVARYTMEKLNEANQNLQKRSFMSPNVLINIIGYVASTVQYIRFLSGKSDAVTPFHLAAGVKLEYNSEVPSQTGNTLWEFFSHALQNSLGLSAFFLEFSQWWQTDRSRTGNKITVPPPPVRHDLDGTNCLLCGLKMKDMTVLSVSGHIFCYKCISDFVEKFKKCPITNVPAELSKIIQLQE